MLRDVPLPPVYRNRVYRALLRARVFVEVQQGQIIPRLYGIAWHPSAYASAFMTSRVVTVPVPFNLLFGLGYWLWWTIKGGVRDPWNARHWRHILDATARQARVLEREASDQRWMKKLAEESRN